MPEDIEQAEMTIFDTETTGLKPDEGHRIVELAGLRVKGKERIAIFDMLIDPGREISPEAFAVNKITPEMLKGAPSAEAPIFKFLDFIAGSCLCSYNAEFDLGFINNELKLLGHPAINDIIIFDVLSMARKLMPNLPRYPLWFVARELGLQRAQEHRAFSDVELTWEVFNRLKIICQEKNVALSSICYKIGTATIF